MKSKWTCPLVAMLAFVCPVVAGEGFIGAAATAGTLEIEEFDDGGTGWKIYGGYRFVRHFAIEAAFVDLGTLESGRDTIHANGGNVLAVGIIPLGAVELFGKAGIALWNPTGKRNTFCGEGTCSEPYFEDGTGPAVGAGVAFKLRRVAIRAEIEKLFLDDVDTFYMGSIGVEWRFAASEGPSSAPADSAGDGHVNFFLGEKFINSGEWEPVEKQTEIGALMSFGRKNWPIHIAVDVLGSVAKETGDETVTGKTVEIALGARKIWRAGNALPYVGGGIAAIAAAVDIRDGSFGRDDQDAAVGPWVSAGTFWRLGARFNIGFDIRWSDADVDLQLQQGSTSHSEFHAGGIHAGLTLGFGW